MASVEDLTTCRVDARRREDEGTENDMLLENKNAVIYGGGGAVGGAVARAFAREGATVHLAGRTRAALDLVAAEIAAAGGKAETAEVDAMDERAVDRHADAVSATSGGIDIALNAVGIAHVQGTPFAELSFEDYAHPISAYTRMNFLTAKAVARHMADAGLRRDPLARPRAGRAVVGSGVPGKRRLGRRRRGAFADPGGGTRAQRHSRELPAATCHSGIGCRPRTRASSSPAWPGYPD